MRTVLDLKAIAQYLVSPGGNTDIMSVYAQIRSNQLGRSLNSLKEASQQAQLLPTSVSYRHTTSRESLGGVCQARLGHEEQQWLLLRHCMSSAVSSQERDLIP